MVKYLDVCEDMGGQRIDNFLINYWHRRCPKSRVYRAIRTGEVRVNKGRIKPTYRLKEGDTVRIPPIQTDMPKPKEGLKAHLDLDAVRLFEDKSLLIINKPSGMPVHAGSGFPFGVVDCLRDHYPPSAFLDLAHRLDRGTSGVLVLAKKKSVLRLLQDDWREHKVKKVYWALVAGKIPLDKVFEVDKPLHAVKASGYHKVYVHKEGKASSTRITVLESYDLGSLIQAEPLTGRMHQIRVHCQSIGYPILGDDTYGDVSKIKRLCLHARSIAFLHPISGEDILVKAPFSQDLVVRLGRLKGST